ncbi:MAG: sulfur oxidation c-type cytochrome SoxA [Betaproteobacteria bacterium]
MKNNILTRQVCMLFVCLLLSFSAISSEQTSIAAPKSGIAYASAQIRALQADDTANPGMLWVANGETFWNEPAGSQAKSCAQCHSAASTGTPAPTAPPMNGAATHYPQFDAATKSLVNLEGRINQCRVKHQGAAPLAYESDALLGLTAFVAYQSRGLPRRITIDESNRVAFEQGAALYRQRMGQMNLACVHCHVQNAGKTLLAENISEGHSNGYPIYRLEWQNVGSLHRRLRSCQLGVRAEPFAPGSDQYLALELYLAWRAGGLPIETPAVRR